MYSVYQLIILGQGSIEGSAGNWAIVANDIETLREAELIADKEKSCKVTEKGKPRNVLYQTGPR